MILAMKCVKHANNLINCFKFDRKNTVNVTHAASQPTTPIRKIYI